MSSTTRSNHLTPRQKRLRRNLLRSIVTQPGNLSVDDEVTLFNYVEAGVLARSRLSKQQHRARMKPETISRLEFESSLGHEAEFHLILAYDFLLRGIASNVRDKFKQFTFDEVHGVAQTAALPTLRSFRPKLGGQRYAAYAKKDIRNRTLKHFSDLSLPVKMTPGDREASVQQFQTLTEKELEWISPDRKGVTAPTLIRQIGGVQYEGPSYFLPRSVPLTSLGDDLADSSTPDGSTRSETEALMIELDEIRIQIIYLIAEHMPPQATAALIHAWGLIPGSAPTPTHGALAEFLGTSPAMARRYVAHAEYLSSFPGFLVRLSRLITPLLDALKASA